MDVTNQKSYGDNDVFMGSEIKTLHIFGSGNIVRIAPSSFLKDLAVSIIGSNNTIEIEEGCVLQGPGIYSFTRVENSLLRIGASTTLGGNGSIQIHEPGSITLGVDCMLAAGVFITNSDMHPIFDLATGDRINPARPVSIGNHVWLGRNVTVHKGAIIGDGSIIGGGSTVTREIESNCLAVGSPAKPKRYGVEWKRNFTDLPTLANVRSP